MAEQKPNVTVGVELFDRDDLDGRHMKPRAAKASEYIQLTASAWLTGGIEPQRFVRLILEVDGSMSIRVTDHWRELKGRKVEDIPPSEQVWKEAEILYLNLSKSELAPRPLVEVAPQ